MYLCSSRAQERTTLQKVVLQSALEPCLLRSPSLWMVMLQTPQTMLQTQQTMLQTPPHHNGSFMLQSRIQPVRNQSSLICKLRLKLMLRTRAWLRELVLQSTLKPCLLKNAWLGTVRRTPEMNSSHSTGQNILNQNGPPPQFLLLQSESSSAKHC